MKAIVYSLLILTFFLPATVMAKPAMSDLEYQQALKNQNQYHGLLQEADFWERQGDLKRAISCHEKAFKMAQGSNSEPVSRGELARLYELNGEYAKALENMEWFIEKSNSSSPLWNKFLISKDRLLQKIEAQKKGSKMQQVSVIPAVSLSRSANIISDFQKADYASQKKFLEKNLPEETEILRLSKQAMLAEHAGKFAEAKGYYEQLLSKKEDVTAAQGDVAWPMLHCAVQRTSELTGDEAREKEMLLWIRDNMFAEQGPYYQYLPGLLPNVQDHLKKRFENFGF